jgi:tRNA threonylcarbamoyladenosine biosynthesis protein TsaE
MEKFIAKTEKETFTFAKKLVSKLHGGEVLCLSGDLGAGKTIFTKGLAAGLGITKIITSPTFVLMKVYPVKNSSFKHLIHIDAYRLNHGEELEAIGALDYFGKSDCLTVIEWPERVSEILPKDRIDIKIKILKDNQREIKISS